MNGSLEFEYRKMKRRYEDLMFDEKEIQKENDENLKYYVENLISEPEWQDMLEKAASHLASGKVKMRIAEAKMEDIRKILKLD